MSVLHAFHHLLQALRLYCLGVHVRVHVQLLVLLVYAIVLEGYTCFTAGTDDVHAALRACHE